MKSVVGIYISKKEIFFLVTAWMDTICHVGLYCKMKAQYKQALRCVLAAGDQLKWP